MHLRPGHFWACQLENADGKSSPIVHTFTKKNEFYVASDGQKYRGDEGECMLLIRCYYHRVASDPTGLTFMRWPAKKGEVLLVNSSELRAISGRQANDFVLHPFDPPPPKLRERHGRAKKGPVVHEIPYPEKQLWRIEEEVDGGTRLVCEQT